MYRMRGAVHLEGSRCDGQAHGGCQAGCNIYWKEAWLKRIPAGEPAPEPGREAERGPAPVARCTLATLTAATRRPADPAAPGEERYACQATELLRAAPERIPSWDVRQYVQDVRSGNAGALATIRTVAVGLFNEYQDASRRLLPRRLRIRDGHGIPSSRAASRRRRSTRSACSPASGFGSGARRRSSPRSTSTTPTAA